MPLPRLVRACVRVRVRVRVRACVRAWLRARVCVCVWARVCLCVFSDEQGRIRHTGVSSSFRGVETISILSFHRTLRPHEMQVLRFHSNSTQGRS